MNKEKKSYDLSANWLDLSKDYRRVLNNYRVANNGDLLIHRERCWELLIRRERLGEEDWLSHMAEKGYIKDYGEFVRAYFKACEKAGIKEISIKVYGFDYANKYCGE